MKTETKSELREKLEDAELALLRIVHDAESLDEARSIARPVVDELERAA